MEKVKSFIVNHSELFTITGLCILFYFLFFHNIWSYPLMDVDETRYVSMSKTMFNSKDFFTLYLNKEFFFEKPPLYFWSECLSFLILGKITEGAARFPAAIYATLSCFMVYFLGKKTLSRTFGVVSALILATSLEYLILAKFAILDIVLASCTTLSIGFGIFTLYSNESNKKYLWWLFYAFSALAVMAKGIPGFVLPFGSMFFIYLYKKQLKEIFKPHYILVGICIFLAITLPWHILMLKIHNPLFYNEYVIKHHVARFFGTQDLGREQPFYFYFLTLLWGLFPWIISIVAVAFGKLVKKEFKLPETSVNKELFIICSIVSLFTILFFSSSKTKLITYILPIYPFISMLAAYIWVNYIKYGKYSKVINATVYTVGGVLIIASIAAVFTQFYLPEQLNTDISEAKFLCIPLLFFTGLLSIIAAKKEKYPYVFSVYVIFMLMLSSFGTAHFFKIDYKFGQDDLMKFAKIAKNDNKSLTCYNFTHKYSLIYYGDENKKVNFGINYSVDDLKNELDKSDRYVIIKKKSIDEEISKLKYTIVDEGRRYIMIKGGE